MKKIAIYLPFVFWMILFVVEITSFIFQNRPMYERAWEYVLTDADSLDNYYVPFKPLLHYDGILIGDLINVFNFTPKPKEIGHQVFQVDEYGFRNRIGMLNHPVEAVTIGTSWVGGAHETQQNLVSELLTDKYDIPTYNYATQSLQHFWEDSRFKVHPPKYVLIIGNEVEFLQNHYIETLQNTTITNQIQKWNSYEQWASINDRPSVDYTSLATLLKHYSVIKYYFRQVYIHLTNALFNRETLAYIYGMQSKYDAKDDVLFYNLGIFEPTISGNLGKNVSPTIQTLLTTQNRLKTRGITMIVAMVPSKESMQAPQYQKLPLKDKALYYLEKDMDKTGIPHINLLNDLSKYVNNTNHLVYYSSDTHWNSYANTVIAKKLAGKIKSIEQTKLSQ